LLVAAFGSFLILAGIFTMDPRVGDPTDVLQPVAKTLPGILHGVAGLLCFGSVAAAALVVARRYWGTMFGAYSIITGLGVIVFFIASSAASVMADMGSVPDAPTGLL
jgi:uncharacterized membrane protein HdeD (DUF308 family)